MTRCGIAALLAGAALVLVADDVTRERFPDADAVLIDEIERVRYNPDGTYARTDEYWTKILTEKGRREESSISRSYSKRYGTASIDYVGIVGSNGVERAVDVTATLKESTDNGSMSANIYDPLDRRIACTVPGLRIGDVLHVKTSRKMTRPRCQNKWADLSVMEWSVPILKSTYEVTSPPELPLRRVAIRHPLGNMSTNATRRADGSVVHTFVVTNAPQAFPEPDMPPLHTQVQCVRVSTAADWPEISKWYWDLCAPHLAKTNAAMVAKTRELVGGRDASTRRTREEWTRDLRAVFKFVSQEVRYMGLTMEDTSPGYAPHDVDVTFDNRYGVCRDKAALLAAMLRLAGYKAYPVLIHVGAKHDPDVPQPFFNHAITAVEDPTLPSPGYVLMDPTDENAKDLCPAYLGDKSYLVARPEGETLLTSDVPPPERNALAIASTGSLEKDGSIVLESDLRFGGINDSAYRHAFVRWQPDDRFKFFERIVRQLASGAELLSCEVMPRDMRDTETPVSAKLVARFPEAVLRGETRDELTVPFLSRSLGMANFLLRGNTSLATRKYPLVLDSTARVAETVRLDLGGALGPVAELPGTESGGCPGYRYERRFAVTNDVLTATRALTVGAVEFSPKAYGDLREEIKRVEAAERRRPVFAHDPLKEADVLWLLNSSETSVHSDRAWTTTNAVVKEVLTYAGKKHAAELKFEFNPAVESLTLVSAVVSNRDGRVCAATAREKNVMDCAWAAAAPRYPAGKILVVNLPSVEIGSVISYTTVRAVTNAAAAFYGTFGFDSREPLERTVAHVDGWRREVVRPRRIPDEPGQPAAALWRDQVVVSSNRFAALDLRIPSVDPAPYVAEPTVRSVRDWMAKHVKVVGPGLWQLPLDLQMTDPAAVLAERYATRLDYMRTMCALLRGAGYEADVVFVASDADDPAELRRRIMHEKPNVRAFATALCRVTQREGGFLGFGGEARVVFVGTENQYAPIGPTAFEGCDYFDPEEGTFGVVTAPDASFAAFTGEESEYLVRENGAVDLTVRNVTRGPAVGRFRKRYEEMLPEDRSRHHQALLGAVAQAASATSDLETDVSSYPATRTFSCYVPDFATVQGDAITIQVPPLVSTLPSLIGRSRQTPFEVGATAEEEEKVTIRFPEGYTEAENLPKPFVFTNPQKPSEVWLSSEVKSSVVDGRLVVELVRRARRRPTTWFGPEVYELVKDWGRVAGARANRTVTARKPCQKRR